MIPEARPAADASGRVFFIFVDDAHLNFRDTARLRQLFTQISDELIHDGDLFGIVSTGTSSIAINPTYDRKRLAEAAQKLSGGALTSNEILSAPTGSQGPAEVRHLAHVAFSTARDIVGQLEQIHDRRKALIYISNGYDLDPYAKTRAKNEAERYGSLRENVENSDSNDPASRARRAISSPSPIWWATSPTSPGRRSGRTRRSTPSTRAGWWPVPISMSRSIGWSSWRWSAPSRTACGSSPI